MKTLNNIKIYVYNMYNECIKGPKQSFYIYWKGYGGLAALIKSLYIWLSIIISIIIVSLNHIFFTDEMWKWNEAATSIIPCILGFALGGYAFLVGFGNGNEKFLDILCSKNSNEDTSIYMTVSASFFHFIFVQFLSLIFSVISKPLHLCGVLFFDIIGVTLFLYAIFTIVSTSFAILNLADWFDTIKNSNNE